MICICVLALAAAAAPATLAATAAAGGVLAHEVGPWGCAVFVYSTCCRVLLTQKRSLIRDVTVTRRRPIQ